MPRGVVGAFSGIKIFECACVCAWDFIDYIMTSSVDENYFLSRIFMDLYI